MQKRSGLVQLGLRLSVPIVGLGAAAQTYYGAVAERLSTDAVIPNHADVANAVGAVVGHVRIASVVMISRPSDGVYRAHVEDGPKDFGELAAAVNYVEDLLEARLRARARANGAEQVDITVTREERSVTIAGNPLFLEMQISVVAIGRPAAATRAQVEPARDAFFMPR
jgi:N-methylhydantoinase A/oxoprolinase/acetone carboxylase beta subunit